MIRRMISRFRLVVPPGWAVTLWLLCYAASEGLIRYFEQQAGIPLVFPIRPGWACLLVGGALLGVHRAMAFHPYFHPDYLRWLKSTPWTVEKPLPAGPVELVPEDFLTIGALMLLCLTQPAGGSIEVLDVFLLSHMIALVSTFWRTEVPGFGYCGALFLGFVPRLWSQPWIALAVLAAIYLFVHEGVWRSLAQFPWRTEGVSAEREGESRLDREFGPSCGWPYDRLLRDVNMAKGIGRVDALLISMLTGWWCFALEAWIDTRWLVQIALMATYPLLIQRGILYFRGYEPPISVAGRIVTLRWIIPGYDQAALFVVLIVIVLPATAGLVGVLWGILGLDLRQALPLFPAALVLIALSTPPKLRRWRLTGRHRLVPAIPRTSQDYVQVG